MLALIAEKPRHGYEIIKAIEERFAGGYTPSPGVVYPTLTMLEELGHATVEETGGKKQYSITVQGRAELAANQAAADAAMARMQDLAGGEGRRGIAPQIIRAMENLKMALRMRQRSGPLSEEQLNNIVNAIDAAALAIERG
jgi:DNA-binding PadR family transcriptional regulator